MATTVGSHPLSAFTVPVNGTSPIDANEVRGNDSTIRTAYNAHDADTGIHVQSSEFGSRPSAGTSGRKWLSVDALSAPTQIRLSYDDGTNWYDLNYFPSAVTIAAGGLTVTAGGVTVSAGDVKVNTSATGAGGLTVSPDVNVTFAEGSGTSYANLFRQANSAGTVIANGYKRSANSNAFASSIGTSWAKSAIGLGTTSDGIVFYTDTAATTANGTDVTPTERMRIAASGNVGIGTNSPSTPLHVVGASTLAGAVTVSAGGITVTGNSSITGTLFVSDSLVATNSITATRANAEVDVYFTRTGSDALTMYFFNTGTLAGLYDGTNTRQVWAYDPVSDGFVVNRNATALGTLSVGNLLAITNTTGPQFSTRYDGSNRLDVTVSSAGAVTYNAVGASAGHTFADAVTVSAGGIAVTGNSTITGTLGGVTALTVDNISIDGNSVTSTSGNLIVRATSGSDTLILASAAGTSQLTLGNGAASLLGVLWMPNGTAADPSLAFTADDDTGIYRVAADTIGIATGGVQRIAVDTTTIALTGALSVSGNTTLGDATSDTLTVTARLASDLTPSTSNARSLGNASLVYANVYAATAYVGADGVASDTYVQTSSVSSATAIATLAALMTTPHYVIVTGRDTPAGTAEFVDVVAVGGNSSTVVTISGTTLEGSPASRTYTISGSSLQLAMGSGTYNIGARVFALPRA